MNDKTVALALLLAVFVSALSAVAQPDGPLADARQLLLVVTGNWNAVDGTLLRFDRPDASAAWQAVGPPIPVVVGRTGLAWGRGLHPSQDGGPVKREGDGKAPAGIFRLGKAFGQVDEAPALWHMPYLFLAGDVECVDDVGSVHYNVLVTKQSVGTPDWKSSEKMWTEPLYKWGVVVEHNQQPVQASGGSCIFLHIWRGPGRGTAGCTAMEEPALTAAIAWLDPARTPLLVQRPREAYARLRSAWGLPGI
ncbi:MAG: hypothetical protein EHM13_06960 [Acidobacteria bacterium]|nr:MAG: hypothetical protein EHM13_06960 [Acidobacteriota bacterium]